MGVQKYLLSIMLVASSFMTIGCPQEPPFVYVQEIESVAIAPSGERLIFTYINEYEAESTIYSCRTDGSDIKRLATMGEPKEELASGVAQLIFKTADVPVCDVLRNLVLGVGFSRRESEHVTWAKSGKIVGEHEDHLFGFGGDGSLQWIANPEQLWASCNRSGLNDIASMLSHPAVSPDGDLIALQDGLIIDVSGKLVSYWKPADSFLRSPIWMSDGKSLAYILYRDQVRKPAVVDSITGKVSEIDVEGGWMPCKGTDFAWSDQGQVFAAYMHQGGSSENAQCKLVTFKPDGKVVGTVDTTVGFDDLALSSDGRTVYVTEANVGSGIRSLFAINTLDGSPTKIVDATTLPRRGKLYSL